MPPILCLQRPPAGSAFALLGLALLVGLVTPALGAVRERLQVAPDARHLQYTDGTPFFYSGDTAWELFHRLTREEATRYLEDRARKGFTVIQAVALAGACGHTHGNNNIWQMWEPGRAPAIQANIPRHEALDHPGAQQMGLMRRFTEANAFHTLVPDQKLIVDGPTSGPAKIRAMRATDGSRVIVYTPRGEPFTLDQSVVKAAYTRQSWFDPRYGVSQEFRVSPRAWDGHTFQTFTPPTSGRGQDWILVFEAVDRTTDTKTPVGN